MIIQSVSSVFSKFLVQGIGGANNALGAGAGGNNPLGNISPPPGVAAYNASADIGILLFMRNMITVITVVAGIWSLFNIVLAGFNYVTSAGDSGTHQKVRDRITMSVIGLGLIVVSYTIVGIMGLIFFGDAGYFLTPTLPGPTP